MSRPYRVESLSAEFDRADFDCGVEALNRYLQVQASQDVRRRMTACFVAIDEESSRIAGYYTLAASGVSLADLPGELVRRLPRYPSVPAARLGRLAVALDHRGRKLGSALLWDAIARAIRSEIAVFAVIVDAKDDEAEAFYRHFGFVPFGSKSRQLVLPLAKLRPK